LARSLNCASGPTPQPCGECQSCIDLAPNGPGSVDVIEIDAATHGKVDNARELRESAAFVPVSSQFKIYIIDEAHELSTDAQNALLKLVEEPPDHLKFVFATTQPEKIPATIKSRTHHYPFRLVPPEILMAHLAKISSEESIKFEAAALGLIATAADGSVRDSLSLLGQLNSGVNADGLTSLYVASQLGLTPAHLIEKTLQALSAGNGAELFTTIDDVVKAGIEPRRFAIDLLNCLRDLLLTATVDTKTNVGTRAQLSTLDSSTVAALANQFGSQTLSLMAAQVAEGIADLRGEVAPRLQLELLAAKLLMLTPAGLVNEVTPGAGSPQVIRAEQNPKSKPAPARGSAPGSATAPAPAPARGSAPAPSQGSATPPESTKKPTAKSPPSKPAKLDLAVVKAHWPAIIEGLMHRRATWMIFTHAAPKSVTESTVSVGLPDLGRTTAAQKSPHMEVLAEAMSIVLEQPVTVEFIHDPSMGVYNNESPAPGKVRDDTEPNIASSSQSDTAQIEEASSDEVVGLKLVEQTLGATRIAEYEDN
jgi:DNA polymerase-3 subunit gamma/tau